ncbi:MAG TPA: ATPase [candidate division WOR-3 bacterium]|uniref:ATPase n=1 Tax=candidate division WOR-3 bacterium TaxID=2052148 RepID=A0A7C0ZE31_UNCW3|nr:ATPase [candidate division WOR-3 bacterium]
MLGYDKEKLNTWVITIKNHHIIKEEIEKMGIVAFIPDGAILPRRTGVDDRPLEDAVPFRSPESLRVEIRLSHGETISGMGILEGVTLITGGGYHGKSTLLRAIERGVYPHIPGDGREYVVTIDTAVKIRAEDGRRVEKVDISPFISYLPYGKNTEEFSTDNASGSTSQAANIMEFIELGAKLLLLDEDTCATNFMIRDERMQELIAKENEPITPFIDRVRELYESLGISTILVMGGAGDYLDVADRVIMMKEFIPYDVSERAREIIRIHPTRRKIETGKGLSMSNHRIPLPDSIDPSRGKRVKIKARDIDEIGFGRETIDLSCVEQIVETAQTKAIGMAIYRMREDVMDGKKTIRECVGWIEERLKQSGVDFLNKGFLLDLSRPRGIEIGAGLNRLRTLKVKRTLKTG